MSSAMAVSQSRRVMAAVQGRAGTAGRDAPPRPRRVCVQPASCRCCAEHVVDEVAATVSISASFIPRVVSAGVPIRMPLVMSGLLSSKGTPFLFTVMPARSSASCASFPVSVLVPEIDQHQVVVGPAGDDVVPVRLPGARRGPGRSGSPASPYVFEGGLERFLEGNRLAGDHVHERPALDAGDDHRVEQLGHLLRAARFRRDQAERVVEVLPHEDQPAARPAQGLVRRGGDDVAVGERIVQQLLAR